MKAWLFVLALLAGPACADPNGILLVAKPDLADPSFAETVVVVTRAQDGSTVGVILNRPLDQRVENYPDRVYAGGPVMREVLVALFTAGETPEDPAFQVLPHVFLTMHPRNIERLLARPGAAVRLFCRLLRLGAAPARSRDRPGRVVRTTRERTCTFPQGYGGPLGRARRSGQRAASYTGSMTSAFRLLAAAALFFISAPLFAEDEAMILVAHPAFRDLEYRQTVLIASPAPNGGHVGVILNRPTRRSLGSLFPEHEPSKKVVDPVFYGGPFSRGALVALVHADQS